MPALKPPRDATRALWAAIGQDDFLAFSGALKRRPELHRGTTDGQNALHKAVLLERTGMVGALIAAGANVNAPSWHSGRHALHYAVLGGQPQITELLISAGANLEARESQQGKTPLLLAATNSNRRHLDALLRAGAEVDALGSDGRTALYELAQFDFAVPFIARLLEAGAVVDRRCAFDETALLCACRTGQPRVVATLLAAGADITAARPDGITPLALARDVVVISEERRREVLAVFAAHAAKLRAQELLQSVPTAKRAGAAPPAVQPR